MKPNPIILSLLALLCSLSGVQGATSVTAGTPEEYQAFLNTYVKNGALFMESLENISLSGALVKRGTTLFNLEVRENTETLASFINIGDISIIGNGTYSAMETSPLPGYRERQIVFQNVGNITFSHLSAGNGGAIQAQSGGLIFSHVKSITLENNTARDTGGIEAGGRGGALYLMGNQKDKPGRLIVSDLEGDFIARNNSTNSYGGGGVIYSVSGGITFERIGNLLFEQNSSGDEGGGAITSGGQANYLSFTETKNISFTSNTTSGYGGAINIAFALAVGQDGLLFQKTGDILFKNNKSQHERGGYGGAIFAMNYDKDQKVDVVFRQTGNVAFIENSADYGGAIYADKFNIGRPVGVKIIGANSVLFEKNHAKKTGSAIYCTNLIIQDCGDISFLNNVTDQAGGAAIVLNMRGTGNNILSADRGDILFRKNSDTERYGIIAWGREEADLLLRAAEGKKISFYDPIYIGRTATMTDEDTLTLEFNREEGYTGTILFSGEDFGEDIAHSAMDGDLIFHKGTLVIEKNAVLEANGEGHSFTLKKGLLDISNGGIIAHDIFMSSSSSGQGTTIKAGKNSELQANHSIDWSQGIAFNLGYYLPSSNSFIDLDGIKLTTPSLILGGRISIADKGNKLEYYESTRWKEANTFVLADLTEAESVSGDFSDIISQLSGSDIVQGFGYNGVWSYENRNGQLLAIWTPAFAPDPAPQPDPQPEPEKTVHPELAGNLTLNSLWSTVSNMRALSRSALGQIGFTRFLLPQNTNYWALGLGDISSHKSVGSIDGYDYNGFGYAVGADTHLADSLIGGLAFGNIYGKNKSRNFNAHIDQASYIGLAYGSWFNAMDKNNSLGIDGTASYGVTSNKLDTHYSDGDSAKGKWDNGAFRFTLRGEWNHALGKSWTLSPFLGIEYDQAQQKSFTESGDKSRNFGKGTLCNLSLPIGLGVSHRAEYAKGKQWINSLTVSYVPDVYRKNPESATLRTTNDFTWTAEGLRPVRNAGRLEYNTRFLINETWALFGGYSLEGRKNALYHNANIGISSTF